MAVTATPSDSNLSEIIPTFPSAALAVTPSDVNTFQLPVAIYVGVAGDVTVRPGNGAAAVLFKNMPAGGVLPIRVSGVNATGTTATNLVAIY